MASIFPLHLYQVVLYQELALFPGSHAWHELEPGNEANQDQEL